MRKKERLEFHWDANNEGLVWTEDGRPLQGLTGGNERIEWIIPDAWRDGKEHTFYIEMACNGMFGNAPGGDSIQPPNPNKYYTLHKAQITAVNLEARALFYDFWIIGGMFGPVTLGSLYHCQLRDDSISCTGSLTWYTRRGQGIPW